MPSIPIDYLILGGVILVAITIAFFVGRGRMFTIVLSTYLAILLFPLFPYLSMLLGESPEAVAATGIQFAIFATMVAIGYLCIGSAISSDWQEGSYGAAMSALPLGLAFAVLIFTLCYHIIPLSPVYTLPSLIDPLFNFANAEFWLLAGPIALLFLGSRR